MVALMVLSASAADTIKNTRVRRQANIAAPAVMPYRPTVGHLTAKTTRRTAANGLTADFSVQTDDAYIAVWSENFDSDERDAKGNLKLDGWTLDQGEGSVITFTKEKKDFDTIDPADVYSLHIDGPYQVFKRTKASATSEPITVPVHGQLHAYVRMAPLWNEYVTLAIQVSTDGFDTFEELWNSKNVTSGSAQWVPVTADLTAYIGKDIQVRLFWGPGTNDTFQTGGYMGDFYVDGLSVTGVQPIDHITVQAGDNVQFSDLTYGGTPTQWLWTFPGGTPATSTSQNPTVVYTQGGTYNVTLRVTDAEGTDEITKTDFVTVESQAPQADVLFPAEFRTLNQPRMRMVPPLAPVEYRDASEGYPTEFTWTFYTPYDLAATEGLFVPDKVYTTQDVTYCHNTLDKCYVLHTAKNQDGYTFVDDSVQVQFQGFVSNLQASDNYFTNFVDGDLTLPGANKMGITAWAERISKPAVPVVLEAMYVGFTKAQAEELTDQISTVSFTLYTSENGMPGQPIELLDAWTLSELNYAMTTNSGLVTIELSRKIVIDQEVFIVIEGIPEKNDQLECAIGMAPLRSNGNTAYMLNKGTWRPFTGYFQTAPGGQTSLAVFPYFSYSVLLPAEVSDSGVITMGSDVTEVGPSAGSTDVLVFANRGIYKYVGSSATWCRTEGTPGDYTIDPVTVAYDALPDGMNEREAVITVSDSIQTLDLTIRQTRSATDGVSTATRQHQETESIERFDLQGRRIGDTRQPQGILLERRNGQVRKVTAK